LNRIKAGEKAAVSRFLTPIPRTFPSLTPISAPKNSVPCIESGRPLIYFFLKIHSWSISQILSFAFLCWLTWEIKLLMYEKAKRHQNRSNLDSDLTPIPGLYIFVTLTLMQDSNSKRFGCGCGGCASLKEVTLLQ
jgi:hypothetical protein